jgi:general secretion pathway protein D
MRPFALKATHSILCAAVLCGAGCSQRPPPSASSLPAPPSIVNFGDLLRTNPDLKSSPNAPASVPQGARSVDDQRGANTPPMIYDPTGDRSSDANTRPMLYYGDASTRQVIPVGDAKPSGEPQQSGVKPVAYVETGVTSADGNKFQVTFENADIAAVVRAILGDILKANYIIDPRVHGTISLSAQRPISGSQMLWLLETALRDQGAVLVHQEGTYRILPANEAHGVGGANVGPDAGMPGYGITALPLQNISAEALNKVLDGFGAAPGAVRIDQGHNLLIVRGSTSERQWLIDTALAFDVDWMRNQSVGIFPVKSGSPEVIINELNQLADASVVKFQPISRLNAILAVSKSRDALHQVSTWILRLDRQSDYGPRVHVFRLKSADARRVVSVLKEIFGSGGSSSGNDTVAPNGPVAIARTPSGNPPPQPGTEGSRSESSAVGGGSSQLGAGLPGENPAGSSKLRITADVASNAVVVYGDQEDYRRVEHAILELDHPVPEVSIEAIAAEVTLNDNLNYGVQYFLGTKLTNGQPGAIAQLSLAPPIAPTIPGFSAILGGLNSPTVVINALRDVTDVKVLSSPSLVVANNQPAILQVGDQVPVTTGTATSTITTQSAIVNSVSYVDTGVILRVTPQIYRTNQVRINIEQEVSAVEQNSNAGTLTPTISQQKIKSTIDVDNGQTILLAGMISQQTSKEKQGVPGVVDVPFLGNVLSNSTNSATRKELIVFVKTQIIRNNGDAQRVANELRRRMPGFNDW